MVLDQVNREVVKYCDVLLGPLLRVMCGMACCPDEGEERFPNGRDLFLPTISRKVMRTFCFGLLLLHQKPRRFSRITPLTSKKQLTRP